MSYYTKAKFLMSAPDIRHLKQDEGIEVAFAGRSNAGKSSALNTLTRQKNLARTSKTPGRTQLINIFELDENHRDLHSFPTRRSSDLFCSGTLRNEKEMAGIAG